jgi:uncharacterized protein (TIGR02391 family)
MINWRYISKRIADEYKSPSGLGHWNEDHLSRTWDSLFDFRFEHYHDPSSMYGNYATFFDYFMTLANYPRWSDEEKVKEMSNLLEEITSGYDRDLFLEILQKGGFETETLELSIGSLGMGSYRFHPEVTKHCQKLLLQGHYVNCIHEGCKAYNKAVQDKSGITKSGPDLMFVAWGRDGTLRLNAYKTESEVDEQEGVKFIAGGLMKGSRNPTSHEPAKNLPISFEECIEILATISHLYRKLDKANVRKP